MRSGSMDLKKNPWSDLYYLCNVGQQLAVIFKLLFYCLHFMQATVTGITNICKVLKLAQIKYLSDVRDILGEGTELHITLCSGFIPTGNLQSWGLNGAWVHAQLAPKFLAFSSPRTILLSILRRLSLVCSKLEPQKTKCNFISV